VSDREQNDKGRPALAVSQRGSDAAGALQQGDDRFRLLVESIVDYGIFMLDTTGRVASWNAGAARMKGLHRAGDPGEALLRLLPT
jgi:PAS domain-containing protein